MAISMEIPFQSKFTQQQVIELVANTLGVPAASLNSESTAGDFVEWDSMGVLCLITAFDREGLTFGPGEAAILLSMQGVLAAFRKAGRLK